MRRVLRPFVAALTLAGTVGLATVGSAASRVTSYSGGGGSPGSCDPAAVEGFVALAQSLDPGTEAQGRALLACLPSGGGKESSRAESRAEVVQWLAFYRAMTGARGGGRDVDDQVDRRQKSSGGSPDEAVGQARAGDYAGLQALFAARDARVLESPVARLTLARALVRKGSGRSGRDSYRAYLVLRPADTAARAEYLYSFLWDRSLDEAERQWTLAEQGRIADPRFADALRRGRALLGRFGGRGAPAVAREPSSTPAPAKTPEEPAVEPAESQPEARARLSLGVERTWRAKTFRRSSVGAAFRGSLVEARLGVHALDQYSLEQARWRAADLVLGVRDDLGRVLEGAAAFGWFAVDAAGESTKEARGMLVGRLGLTVRPFRALPALAASLRAERQPLAKLLPLTRDASVMPRDSLGLALGWSGYLDLESEFGRDGATALWERHQLVGQIPVLDAASVGRVALRLPARYEAHPRPHPEYDAPSTLSLAGVGVALGTAAGPGVPLAAALTIDQLWGELTDRRRPAKHEQLRELAWSLGLSGRLRSRWIWEMQARASLVPAPESVGAAAEGVSALGSLSRELGP